MQSRAQAGHGGGAALTHMVTRKRQLEWKLLSLQVTYRYIPLQWKLLSLQVRRAPRGGAPGHEEGRHEMGIGAGAWVVGWRGDSTRRQLAGWEL